MMPELRTTPCNARGMRRYLKARGINETGASMRTSSVSRRGFLKGAAGAVAAPYLIPAGALGAEGRVAASNRIGIGSIGVKNMGGGHLSNLLGNKEVQVIGVCDVDAAVRKAAKDRAEKAYAAAAPTGWYRGVAEYNDFRELIARPDVDAVCIAVPDHWHALIALTAIKAGKDVYCEKPLTLTIHEGRILSEAAQRYGRVFQTGSQHRSEIKSRLACELVRNGRIGKLDRVEVGVGRRPTKPEFHKDEPVPEGFDYNLWLGPAPWAPYTKSRCHYNFRFIRDYSGGEMTNFGAHYLDLAQWGIGADDSGPVEIDGQGVYLREGIWDTFAEVEITYTYTNGVKLHCSDKGQGTRFFGTEGWVDIGGACEPKNLATTVFGPHETRLYESRSHWGNFLDCMRTRRPTICPAEVGHRSATVAHLGNISMTLGRKLRWDPKAERFVNDPEADRLLWRPTRQPWSL